MSRSEIRNSEHLRAQGARRLALLIGSERRNSYVETESVYRSIAAEAGMEAIATAEKIAGEEGG